MSADRHAAQLAEVRFRGAVTTPTPTAIDTHAEGGATVEPHRYASGRPFWLAICHGCGLVLNSGHHYRTEASARAEVDRHNAQVAEILEEVGR